MLEAPLNENPEQFRFRINNYLENNPLDDTNIHETATSLHSIAQSYFIEGNGWEAKPYLQRAIELYRKTSDEHSLIFCLGQYASVLRYLSKREEAEELLTEVVRMSKKLSIKRNDIKNWFLKPYFHALLEIFNEPMEALALKKKLEQAYISSKENI